MKRRNESSEVSEAKRFVVESQELSNDQLDQVLFCVVEISQLMVFRLVSRKQREQLNKQWFSKMLDELNAPYTNVPYRTVAWRQIGILYHLEPSLPQNVFQFFRGEVQKKFRPDDVGLWTTTPRRWGFVDTAETSVSKIPRFLAWRLAGDARVLPGSVCGLLGRDFVLDAHCSAMPFEMFIQAFSILVTQGDLLPATVSEIIYTLALLGYPRTQIAILVELA